MNAISILKQKRTWGWIIVIIALYFAINGEIHGFDPVISMFAGVNIGIFILVFMMEWFKSKIERPIGVVLFLLVLLVANHFVYSNLYSRGLL